jgi:hypothetical protein
MSNTATAWTPPASVEEALRRARAIIATENRWIQGSFFEVPMEDKVCTDVQACAAGAIILVCRDGIALETWENGDFDELDQISDNPIARESIKLVAEAMVIENCWPRNYHVNNTDSCLRGIITFNDQPRPQDWDSEDATQEFLIGHLKKIISVFDKAIELAAQNK